MSPFLPPAPPLPLSAHLELPGWLPAWWSSRAAVSPTDSPADRLALIGELAVENVRRGGGPFSAGVWDLEGKCWISAGVNLVLSSNVSSAHAEIVALSLAQTALGGWNLGAGGRRLELVSSAEPCAMCTGAVPWSGVVSLIFGASRQDAEGAGFDEGAKMRTWKAELEKRGVSVVGPLPATAARQALADFARLHPPYNGRPRPPLK